MNTPEQNKNGGEKGFPMRYIVYLILVLVLIAGVTLSRYALNMSGYDSARTAQLDYEIEVLRNPADTIATNDDYLDFDTSGSGTELNNLSGNETQSVSFDVSIFATTKLSDPVAGGFDDTARIIDVTFTNTSEVTVDAAIATGTTDITVPGVVSGNTGENGIVWCIFDGSYTDYNDIISKIGYTPTNDDYATLISQLNLANSATLADWNADTELAPGESKTLTIVFWAEHVAVTDYGWDFLSALTSKTIKIDYDVIQVD